MDIREVIKEFLDEVGSVPFRQIDCNQERVYELMDIMDEYVNEKDSGV